MGRFRPVPGFLFHVSHCLLHNNDVRRTICLLFLLCPLLSARIRPPLGYEDIRGLAKDAPLVFRGRVVQVDLSRNDHGSKEGVAFISADRWYKGERTSLDLSRVPVRFAYYSGGFLEGHNCSDLVLDSYWIIFAKSAADTAALELIHDCEGALSVSSALATSAGGDLTKQIEADFRAGLSDADPHARLVSIQRLAGLASPASREGLHDVIAHDNEEESRWALFAAVKTGDVSVMPLAVPVLIAVRHDRPGPYRQPEGNLALALRELHTQEAVPYLVQTVDDAPDEVVRDCAMQSLAELKSVTALETYARHLTDSSQYVRYNAMLGMKYVTQAAACSSSNPDNADANELRCKQWWGSEGKSEFRP